MEQQQEALGRYKKAFGAMVQAGLKREGARSKLGDTADNAVARVAEVEKTLLQGDNVSQFNSVVELSKLLQQARFQVRGYTYSGKAEAQQPALDAIDNALSYLKSLPLDKIKIDKSFVQDLLDDEDDATIVRAIIQLGKSLGMQVIAEGVETLEQEAYIIAQGCNEGQGYLYSKPLPARELTGYLKQARRLSIAANPATL